MVVLLLTCDEVSPSSYLAFSTFFEASYMGSKRRKTKRKKAKKGITSKRRAALRQSSADAGPVTLNEAKVLAASRRTTRSSRLASGVVTPSPSPEGVAVERERLERERREEFARRISEYKAVMEVMKQRGARRTARNAEGGHQATEFQPLQIFAEGDSWFDYPAFLRGGVIPRLEQRLGVPILNLAKAGDEVRYMLGVENASSSSST